MKSGCLTRTFFGQRLKLSLLGRRDQRLKRAEIGLTMGMMMAMNHDSGHVGDDVVHPKAGEGGRADPGEHRLVERQAQGGSDCPSGLVWSSLSSLLASSAESPPIVRTFYETKVD